MAVYKGPQDAAPKHNSSESGNAWLDDNQVAIGAAALTTADEVILMEVPAGTRLTQLRYRNGDLDTHATVPTLAGNIGYRSKHPDQQMVANPTYFATATTTFQAPNTAWQELVFNPLDVTEPIQIIFKPTVNAATGGAATISMIGEGKVVGPR